MVTTFDTAIAKAHSLPEVDQERIGHELSAYIDHLHALRHDLAQGVQSLDKGLGREINIDSLLN